MRTSSAAAVVPPGEVTFRRAGRGADRCGGAPRPRDSGAGEARREVGRQARRRARPGQALGQEDVGRPGAGHGRDRIDERLGGEPLDAADAGEQQIRHLALLGSPGLRHAPVAPRPMLAGRFGMARTTARARGQTGRAGRRSSCRPGSRPGRVSGPISASMAGAASSSALRLDGENHGLGGRGRRRRDSGAMPRAAAERAISGAGWGRASLRPTGRGRRRASRPRWRRPSCRRRPGPGCGAGLAMRPEMKWASAPGIGDQTRSSASVSPCAANSLNQAQASPCVSNSTASSASRADLPAQMHELECLVIAFAGVGRRLEQHFALTRSLAPRRRRAAGRGGT